MTKTIIITTGGTGGHIFPARAVAEKLSNDGLKVIILGDRNYPKYHNPQSSFSFKIISSSQVKRGFIPILISAIKIAFGILQSIFWMIFYRPQIVVAFGGYATFPVLIAAIILRRKIILHEQNAHLGKVNRLFTRFADKIALSYKETGGIYHPSKSGKFVFTGNPIRSEIIELSKNEYQLPDLNQPEKQPDNLGYNVLLASEFRHQNNRTKAVFNILVIGGSGGAKIFSEILPKAFFNLRGEIKNRINIIQQCRAEQLQSTFEQYKSFNLNIIINSFFDDMPKKISAAHLVIARSGSSSLAEFTCAKRPMILVPFALAADNHQEKNAKYVEKMGGAIVTKEADFTISNVTNILEKLIDNPMLLKKMSDNSFKCANLNATNNLADLIN